LCIKVNERSESQGIRNLKSFIYHFINSIKRVQICRRGDGTGIIST
jgi:hypothetical protein